MKARVLDAVYWTPERGALSAEDGLGGLSRFVRTCAAITERLRGPDVTSRVVVASCTGAADPPASVASELEARWSGARVSVVSAGVETVPASFLEAAFMLELADVVLWTVVDLFPGAELGASFVLGRASTGPTLELTRLREPEPQPDPHLNPCAPVLRLEAAVGASIPPIRVGSWGLSLHDAG